MNLIKGALQQELDKFFQTIEGTDVALSKVTKSAFCTARKLISSQAFVELNQVALKSVYDQATLKQWHGFRLCAVDGTKLRIFPLCATILAFKPMALRTRLVQWPLPRHLTMSSMT